MESVLSNCCCLLRKYSFSTELDMRLLRIRSFTLRSVKYLILLQNAEGFSFFFNSKDITFDVSLYAGIRAIKLNRLVNI